MEKILWVKFGWSEYYRGGLIDGNFGWLNENRINKEGAKGHEAFNFKPSDKGAYFCYVPPQGGKYAPYNKDNSGWTVICLAKNPKYKGIHVVGWYENATLLGNWFTASSDNFRDIPSSAYDWSYCIKSDKAYFIPPESRVNPFSDPSVRQAKFSFLSGPDIKETENKKRVLTLLRSQIEKLRQFAVMNPNETNAPNPELNSADPLMGFGTPEHRKSVEIAAENAVVEYYKNLGYTAERVAHLNLGFDFKFSKNKRILYVEVKGTSSKNQSFFMTRNENNQRGKAGWILAIVTNALSKEPEVHIYNNDKFEEKFEFEAYVYIGKKIDDY